MKRHPLDTLRSRPLGALTLAMAYSRALERRRPRRTRKTPQRPRPDQIRLPLEEGNQ